MVEEVLKASLISREGWAVDLVLSIEGCEQVL